MELKIFVNDEEMKLNKNEIIREYLEEQRNKIKIMNCENKDTILNYLQCISFMLINLD